MWFLYQALNEEAQRRADSEGGWVRESDRGFGPPDLQDDRSYYRLYSEDYGPEDPRRYERGYGRDRGARRGYDWERDYFRRGYAGADADRDYEEFRGYDYGDENYYTRTRPPQERGEGRFGFPAEAWGFPGGGEGPFTGVGPRGYRRSDERICEDVCERLTQHGQIDASDVEVEVNDGEVTLRGTVNTRREKRLADDMADSVRGVRDVHNRLRVTAP